MPDFQLEHSVLKRGFKSIAGLDEVGRGALFGPVVAASVIFPNSLIKQGVRGWVTEINDSKLLSPNRRKKVFRKILIHADSMGFGMVTNSEIDHQNISWASLEAMRRAVQNMPLTPDFLLVDGFNLSDVNYSQRKVLQGDKKSISIAAASIIAKVLRDEMVIHLDQIFKGYSLSKNKGYGTKEHYFALQRMGPSVLHRFTFNLKDSK